MSANMRYFQSIDKSIATDIQVLAVKHVEIYVQGMGYTATGNHPDNTAKIEITGVPGPGTVKRFVIIFYPAGDTRLANPSYNSDQTILTVTQTLAVLPGWIACLTAIPTNEATTVNYWATSDSYEFGCVRVLTQK